MKALLELFKQVQQDEEFDAIKIGLELLVLLDLLEELKKRFHQYLSRSMSMPSERISLTSTLNDSGIPASILWSPLTMFSYTLVRPVMSSDLTVSISCSV